jgi:hypothetical protein
METGTAGRYAGNDPGRRHGDDGSRTAHGDCGGKTDDCMTNNNPATIAERNADAEGSGLRKRCRTRHIQRYPTGTAYSEAVNGRAA